MTSTQTDLHTLLKSVKLAFADDKLERFDVSKFQGVPYNYYTGSVDLGSVVGTDHSDYADSTWLELLPTRSDDFTHIEYYDRHLHQGKLKRGWKCINELCSMPDYYTSLDEKSHWSFAKVGDRYYVTEGNHRTVVGRFFLSLNNLPTVIHGVSITEYHVPPVQVDAKPQGWRSKWNSLFG